MIDYAKQMNEAYAAITRAAYGDPIEREIRDERTGCYRLPLHPAHFDPPHYADLHDPDCDGHCKIFEAENGRK